MQEIEDKDQDVEYLEKEANKHREKQQDDENDNEEAFDEENNTDYNRFLHSTKSSNPTYKYASDGEEAVSTIYEFLALHVNSCTLSSMLTVSLKLSSLLPTSLSRDLIGLLWLSCSVCL